MYWIGSRCVWPAAGVDQEEWHDLRPGKTYRLAPGKPAEEVSHPIP